MVLYGDSLKWTLQKQRNVGWAENAIALDAPHSI